MKFLRIVTLALLPLLAACTTMVPRKDLPPPLTDSSFGDPVKTVSIPLPVIASSPNEGITSGALTAFLLHNSRDEISTLLAPQVNYNQNFGVTATVYGAFYPRPDRNWEFNIAKSTKVNEDYEIRFRDKTLMDGKLETNLFLYDWNDGSARFYGFQSTSSKTNESNYADNELGLTASAGYDVAKRFQVVLGERLRKVRIQPGAVTSLPFIQQNFTADAVPGINGFSTHAQKLSIVHNTLDSLTMPTIGGYVKVSAEVSARFLGSSADYRHYEAEVKGYYPLDNARYISVFRLVYNQSLGQSVPFLERSILGGETTLRGYGRNRFIDSSYFLCNLEERIRLFRWEIFNVNADWEVAPFVDLGSVMESLDKASVQSFEFNPGVGLRAVVRPNIVGRIDVGFGKEGPAVFVGLGYPF